MTHNLTPWPVLDYLLVACMVVVGLCIMGYSRSRGTGRR